MYRLLILMTLMSFGAILAPAQTISSWGCTPTPATGDVCANDTTTTNGFAAAGAYATCSNSRVLDVDGFAAAWNCTFPVYLRASAGKWHASMIFSTSHTTACSPDQVIYWDCSWSVVDVYGGCFSSC